MRQFGDLVLDRRHRDAFVQVVGADPVGRLANQPDGPQHQLALAIADDHADDYCQRQQSGEHLAIAAHHGGDRRHRRGHRDFERRELVLRHPQRADRVEVGGVELLAGNVGNRLAMQIARAEEPVGHRPMHVDVEQRRRGLRRLADPVVDRRWCQGSVVTAERRGEVLELRLVEDVELAHQLVAQEIVACDEQACERRGDGDHVPGGDPPADRSHGHARTKAGRKFLAGSGMAFARVRPRVSRRGGVPEDRVEREGVPSGSTMTPKAHS